MSDEGWTHIEHGKLRQLHAMADEAERLRNVIRTGGAMYRAERAAMGIPGGIDPDALPLPQRLAINVGLGTGKTALMLRQAFDAAKQGVTTRIEYPGGTVLVMPEPATTHARADKEKRGT